jgi:hypothetical protein
VQITDIRATTVTTVVLLFAALLRSQTPPALPPINTDRPAFADSSVVVPKGSLQIENGFQDTATAGQHTEDLPETLFRYGLADKTELRVSAPDYVFTSGFGDLSAGVKQQLGPIHGFDVSVVITLSFPTGARVLSSHGYEPSIQFPWSHSLPKNWTAAGMFSVYWPTQGRSRNVTGQVTFLFDRQITGPWDAFLEYLGDYPQRGGPEHLIHFGTSYKVTPRQQVDFDIGAGLSAAAPGHLLGVGYSFRVDKRR